MGSFQREVGIFLVFLPLSRFLLLRGEDQLNLFVGILLNRVLSLSNYLRRNNAFSLKDPVPVVRADLLSVFKPELSLLLLKFQPGVVVQSKWMTCHLFLLLLSQQLLMCVF